MRGHWQPRCHKEPPELLLPQPREGGGRPVLFWRDFSGSILTRSQHSILDLPVGLRHPAPNVAPHFKPVARGWVQRSCRTDFGGLSNSLPAPQGMPLVCWRIASHNGAAAKALSVKRPSF